jgi:hypothetical protein
VLAGAVKDLAVVLMRLCFEKNGERRMPNGNRDGNDPDQMDILGELICRLNPYTRRTDPDSGKTTGDMDVLLAPDSLGDPKNPYAKVQMEVDTKYPGTWSFKGQAQTVNTAVRIRYRYPVKNKDGKFMYWVDDYLLLGYEGSGGG